MESHPGTGGELDTAGELNSEGERRYDAEGRSVPAVGGRFPGPVGAPASARNGSGRAIPGPDGEGKASAAELLRPAHDRPGPSGLAAFGWMVILSFCGLEMLSNFLPQVPSSLFTRWLAVAVDHPLRCALALAFLGTALLPPLRGPSRVPSSAPT